MSDVVSVESGLFSADKRRKIAIALAFAGSLPTPLPLTWLHKFYLGQYLWGIVYLVLAPTYIPKVACCLEGIWYLSQNNDQFVRRFPSAGTLLARGLSTTPDTERAIQRQTAETAQQVAIALRELDTLRQEGLITEYEFEQKRRKLLGEID
ncbi:MAG: SHOCT domain-containing protein [Cyanobacteria bacterium J06606_4]